MIDTTQIRAPEDVLRDGRQNPYRMDGRTHLEMPGVRT